MINKSVIDELIIGRVEPHIYAFSTNTIPNYLKVGDTYRPVAVRLKEWQIHFPELIKRFESTAKISDDIYFRDFAVHQFLEMDKHKDRLKTNDIFPEVYYSKEFFKDTTFHDVEEAVFDIKRDYDEKTQKYQFYNAENRLAEKLTFSRMESFLPRPNQTKTIDNFKTAVANGRNNLLMYAVMRFGKSFTSMCCAVEMDAKVIMIVSAKADVLLEWKRTVESHKKFADYDFISSDDLLGNNKLISETISAGRKVVAFLTLQDLQGNDIKNKHREIFSIQINLLIVDETHFGARAEKYGEVLKQDKSLKDVLNKKDTGEDFVEINEAEEYLKVIDRNITIHLSGTPYRILMGSEFKKEDIIAFYQFTDIVEDQEKWNKEYILDDNYKEWDNPYYGFPQMVRFAFNPNESSRQKLKELRDSGVTYVFSALLKPKSIKKADDGSHKKFKYESEILDLLEVIDGSKLDDNLLGFLDYDKIKEGKMCRHIVIVLPYCASCDALEALIENNRDKFRNLSEYEIINISSVDNSNSYRSSEEIKQKITKFEATGKKTITLTVNRMLTGSTVPEWDAMLYLKDTASPQEYDQAIFRLQNQYIKKFTAKNDNIMKCNMKPQTLLVDFDPNRMFVMQEQKAQIYNVNIDDAGNTKLKDRVAEELRISPIIVLNNDKIVRVEAADILAAVSNYAKDKGIKDEALEISVDLDMLRFEVFRKIIEKENEIGSRLGLSTSAHKGENGEEGNDLNVPQSEGPKKLDTEEVLPDNESETPSSDDKYKEEISNTKRIQMYYTRILLYSFITKNRVISLSDIIENMETTDNSRIAKNLGLSKEALALLNNHNSKWSLRQLDYKIQDLNDLSHSENMQPAERAGVAVNKFGKLGDAIVTTPSNICKDMTDLLPDNFIKEVAENRGRILDIAGTSGEFAVAIYNKMQSLNINEDKIKDRIYTIPKSSICYELTRKLYEMLGLNTDNIATFVATDMLKIKDGDEIDYDKICKLLQQNKPFNQIKLEDDISKGEIDMIKFDAIVGNPPYQTYLLGSSDTQIYDKFIDVSYSLSNICCLISPAKFLFNAGKTSKKWNEKMLNNEHIKIARFEQNSSNIFPYTEVKGGIAITYMNKSINFGKIGFFTVYKELFSIIDKVLKFDFCSFNKLIYAPESYKFTEELHNDYPDIKNKMSIGHHYDVVSNIFESLPEIFYDVKPKDMEDYIQIFGLEKKHRKFKWIKRKYIKCHANLESYKIFVPKSNGSGAIGEILSTPLIGEPLIGHTQSFISIGSFKTKYEALATLKYVKTKFVRTMLGTLKATQDNKKRTWQNVPLQDFTERSDIDWSKTIAEIDKELYTKYALDDSEIAFIESMIKPMEQ